MKILPLTYLGNIEYFSELCSGEGVVIDIGENYVKQTYRNRCEIMTVGGVAPLTVNVVKGRSIDKKPVREMRIDYSRRWQHQHRVSLVSAYASSPYFDHYWGRIEPFFLREYGFLCDLNRDLLHAMLDLLGLKPDLRYSEDYVRAAPGDIDLRGLFAPVVRERQTGLIAENAARTPGKRKAGDNLPATQPYWQVFSEKFPFAPNLSVIDLLFCEGPAAGATILTGEK